MLPRLARPSSGLAIRHCGFSTVNSTSSKSVLVTGGALGLGEAISRRLRADGFAVYVADVDDERGLALAEELGVPITLTDKHDLNMFTNNRPHQGVVLTAEPLRREGVGKEAGVAAAIQRAEAVKSAVKSAVSAALLEERQGRARCGRRAEEAGEPELGEGEVEEEKEGEEEGEESENEGEEEAVRGSSAAAAVSC